jgi:integral membrane protein (TIGR01906 family)
LRFLQVIARALFIIAVPVFLLSATVGWEITSLWTYRYSFEKYNISELTGLSPTELERVATGLAGYFRFDEDYVSITVVKDGQSFDIFNQGEIIHFKDVKNLVLLGNRLGHIALGYLLAFTAVSLLWRRKRYWPDLGRVLVGGGLATLILMLLTGLMAAINFDWFFLQFHLLSFTNEYWLSSGYMPILFPQGFWYDMALFTALVTAGLAVLSMVVGWGWLRFVRRQPAH